MGYGIHKGEALVRVATETKTIMSSRKKYKINPETLLYEIDKVSAKSRFLDFLFKSLGMIAMCFVYFWLYTSVFGLELPKTTILKKQNAEWVSRLEVLGKEMEQCESTLAGLQMRDDQIYRNIFGMNEISPEVRNAGFGGVNRYSYLDVMGPNSLLLRTTMRQDILTKKTYVQSKSFDEISAISKRAGDMASCIPAISPFLTDDSKYTLTSPFGYRSDPITGSSKMHTGFDFACPPGNPVYATGDGVIESVKFELFGYGNSVVIDHGFGYKTRYAHMKSIYVAEGMSIKRGECLGESGNSGRVTGPHLHYEVMYRDEYVNPENYMDLTMPKEEYAEMVKKAAQQSSKVLTPHTRVKMPN